MEYVEEENKGLWMDDVVRKLVEELKKQTLYAVGEYCHTALLTMKLQY